MVEVVGRDLIQASRFVSRGEGKGLLELSKSEGAVEEGEARMTRGGSSTSGLCGTGGSGLSVPVRTCRRGRQVNAAVGKVAVEKGGLGKVVSSLGRGTGDGRVEGVAAIDHCADDPPCLVGGDGGAERLPALCTSGIDEEAGLSAGALHADLVSQQPRAEEFAEGMASSSNSLATSRAEAQCGASTTRAGDGIVALSGRLHGNDNPGIELLDGSIQWSGAGGKLSLKLLGEKGPVGTAKIRGGTSERAAREPRPRSSIETDGEKAAEMVTAQMFSQSASGRTGEAIRDESEVRRRGESRG